MDSYHLTVEQLQEILAHDGPTDIWLLQEDGTISVIPDQPIGPFMRTGVWPRYLVRSKFLDRIMMEAYRDENLGYLTALAFINKEIDRVTATGPAARMGEALGRMVTQMFTASQQR
jgi:hypothetical protein